MAILLLTLSLGSPPEIVEVCGFCSRILGSHESKIFGFRELDLRRLFLRFCIIVFQISIRQTAIFALDLAQKRNICTIRAKSLEKLATLIPWCLLQEETNQQFCQKVCLQLPVVKSKLKFSFWFFKSFMAI